MSHLTPSELVDLVDGQLEAVRARHVDACDFCRKQFDDLQESLRLSSGVEMPEPSALFWDHLSGRVREGIAETANERSWMERNLWRGARAPRFISAIAALLIVVAAGWYLRPAPTLEAPRVNPPADSQSTAIALDPKASDAWATVRAAAERVDWEEAEAARPGRAT